MTVKEFDLIVQEEISQLTTEETVQLYNEFLSDGSQYEYREEGGKQEIIKMGV